MQQILVNSQIELLISPNRPDYQLGVLKVIDLKQTSDQPQLEVIRELVSPQLVNLDHFFLDSLLLLRLMPSIEHSPIQTGILLVQDLQIVSVVHLDVIRYLVHDLSLGH